MVTITTIIEAFLNTPPDYLLITVLTWIYILPIILLLRNYRKTNSVDYLIMAGIFLLLMIQLNVGALSLTLMIPPIYLPMVWFDWATLFTWYLHAIRVRWKSPPMILVLISILVLVLPLTFQEDIIIYIKHVIVLMILGQLTWIYTPIFTLKMKYSAT